MKPHYNFDHIHPSQINYKYMWNNTYLKSMKTGFKKSKTVGNRTFKRTSKMLVRASQLVLKSARDSTNLSADFSYKVIILLFNL